MAEPPPPELARMGEALFIAAAREDFKALAAIFASDRALAERAVQMSGLVAWRARSAASPSCGGSCRG